MENSRHAQQIVNDIPSMTLRKSIAFGAAALIVVAAVVAGIFVFGGGNEPGQPQPSDPAPTANTVVGEKAEATEACKQFVIDEITPAGDVEFPVVAPQLEGEGVYKVTGTASTGGESVHFDCMVARVSGSWRLVQAVEIN